MKKLNNGLRYSQPIKFFGWLAISGPTKQPKDIVGLLYLTLIFLVMALLPAISASEITTDSYSVSSYHLGTATSGNSSTSSYEFRYTTTYEQGSNRDVATLSYSANSGWLNNSLYINNDELPVEEEVCSSQSLNLCTTESACTGVGGYWYNNICNAVPQVVEPKRRPGDGGVATGKVVESIEKKIGEKVIRTFREGDKIEVHLKTGKEVLMFILELMEIKEEDVLIKAYLDENGTKTEKKSVITGNVIHDPKKEILSLRLNIGQEEKLDLTNDGHYDILLELGNIEGKKAIIRSELLHEKIVEGKIEPTKEPVQPTLPTPKSAWTSPVFLFSILLIAIFVSVIIVYIIRKRLKIETLEGRLEEIKALKKSRKIDKEIYSKERKEILERLYKIISTKHFVAGFVSLILIGFITIAGSRITGMSIATLNQITESPVGITIPAITIFVVIMLLIFRNRIFRFIESRERNKYPKNSAKGLIKKKVYTEEGDFIGRIKDVILHDGKIYSIKIKLDKRKKFKLKGIVVKYKHVKSSGHIVLLDKEVSAHL